VKEVHLYDPDEFEDKGYEVAGTMYFHHKAKAPAKVEADVFMNDVYVKDKGGKKILRIPFKARVWSAKRFYGEAGKHHLDSVYYYQIRRTKQREYREVYPPRYLGPYKERGLGRCPACRELSYMLPYDYNIPERQKHLWAILHGVTSCELSAGLRRPEQRYVSAITLRPHVSPVGYTTTAPVVTDIQFNKFDLTTIVDGWWRHRSLLMMTPNFLAVDVQVGLTVAGGTGIDNDVDWPRYEVPPEYKHVPRLFELPLNHYLNRVYLNLEKGLLVVDNTVCFLRYREYTREELVKRKKVKEKSRPILVPELVGHPPAEIFFQMEGVQYRYQDWVNLEDKVDQMLRLRSVIQI
jgi:hypothetical protein